jgi:hypothetical protein
MAALLLIGCLLLPVARAGAEYDPVAGGTTRLKLHPSFIDLMRRNGVGISAVAPAVLRGGTVFFPVVEGKFDPVGEKGTLRHDGALVLRRGNRKLPLKALQLKTAARRSPLSAKLGGGQLKIGTVKQLVVSRRGFGNRVRIAAWALSAKAATRIAKKLRLRGVVKAGQPVGRIVTTVDPATVTLLPRGRVTVTLDPGFAAKLSSLFVAVNPIFPAEHPGPFTMPIAAGSISPAGVGGLVETQGALEFIQLHGGQVFWAETRLDLAARTVLPEIDVEPSPPYAGKAGAAVVGSWGGGAFVADPKSRAISLAWATQTLNTAAAATFNQVFAEPQGKQEVFVPGEAVASVSFEAQGQ